MIDLPRPAEKEQLVTLARETGFFAPVEITTIAELLDEFYTPRPGSDYSFLVYREASGEPPLGFVCYGPIAMTEGSYDLYWIVVGPAHQNKKIGRQLLTAVEAELRRAGGRVLYIETSDTEQYAPTRAFYDRAGYDRAAHLPGFYKPGDGKVVFSKFL